MVRRGEIYWIDVPDGGRHPACILMRDQAIPVMSKVTVAAITSTVRGAGSEVRLTRDDGMSSECVISLDNLHTIPRSSLSRPVTQLSATKMYEVCRALDFASGCR